MRAPDRLTPSQTVGPFFTLGLNQSAPHESNRSPVSNVITGDGKKISIIGKVMDGNHDPVVDALIEIWQADSTGKFNNPHFFGFARSHTGQCEEQKFLFNTIKPGPNSEYVAPHICAVVHMRGLLTQLYTRIYFSDESEANSRDQVLTQIPQVRRPSLIAQQKESAEGKVYEFDIYMQGDQETVFFHL